MKTLAALLLVAVAALSGCVGSDTQGDDELDRFDETTLPAAALDPKAAEEVWVTASDGKRLHNAVFRPDTDQPVGTFINFSPYWGDSAMAAGDPFSQYMVAEYVPRGFAVVLSAVRGTGHSEGCFAIGGDRESLDVHEVVDYFAKQPWSNGRIAAGGKSYDSTSQNGMIAKFPHDALKGLFHVSGITDMYRYNYIDGVPTSNGLQFTPRYYATQGLDEYSSLPVLGTGAGSPSDEGPDSMTRLFDDVACPEFPEHVASGEGSAAHGIKDAYWQERDWTRTIAASNWTGNIFFVHGLQDWNVRPDHILPWISELPPSVPVLGWLHQWQQDGTGHVYPMRADWNQTMLRWMDHTLNGNDAGMDALWGYEVQGSDGNWRRSPTWGDAVASDHPALDVACNATCSIITSTVLEAGAATRISGAPQVTVAWTAQSADPVLSAVLYEVNGTERTWVSEAVLRGTLRDSLESPSPVVIGTQYESTLTFFPVDHVVAVGNSLVVEFGGNPTHSIAPQATLAGSPPLAPGSPLPGDVLYDAENAVVSMQTSDPAVGLLSLQPDPMRCFTC